MENKTEKQTTDDILIYGATNKKVIEAVEALSKQEGIELVRLEDRVLTDYLNSKNKAENEPKAVTVEEFINNPENRKAAEEKAFYLWNILTMNAKTDLAMNRIFSKSEVVQKTTLSNKKLGELLDTLQLFGLVVFTKGNYEFKFIFGEELQKAEAYADIVDVTSTLNVEITRYLSLQKTDEEKQKAIEELKIISRNSLSFDYIYFG